MNNFSRATYDQIEKEIEFQRVNHMQYLPLRGVAEVGQSVHKLSVGNYGALHVLMITGKYETTLLVEETITDTGSCYLSGKLGDGSRNRTLFDDFIALDLFLTPGRVKSLADTSPYPTQLFQPFEIDYIFDCNSDIIMEIENRSNRPQAFEFMFACRRIYTANRGK